MLDIMLQDGDLAQFMPAFGPAVVVVRPGRMSGSGPAKIKGKPICVVGDEMRLQVPGCNYVSGPHVIPGVGTLKITSLAPNQRSMKLKIKGKPAILKGMMFTARFEVQSPAQQPTPAGPVPDPVPIYMGQGNFISTNVQVKGS